MIKEPITVNGMTLSTRIIMPPMATAATEDGIINSKLVEYYTERAKNPNISLIIMEHGYISEEGKAHDKQVSYADDSVIEGLRQLTDAMRAENTYSVAQINHAGCVAKNSYTPLNVNDLSKEEIARIVRLFAEASVRVIKGGFDGIEIHSAHRYLLNQFYSPVYNQRTDEYGPQSVENRTRVHVEVIKAVREAVGKDIPVFVRLGGCDYTEGGSTIEDAVKASVILEKAGYDCIDLSGGACSYRHPECSEPGWFKDMTAEVKKNVSIPVILTGGITEASQAEQLLNDGAADLIGVGRAVLKDAHWNEQ